MLSSMSLHSNNSDANFLTFLRAVMRHWVALVGGCAVVVLLGVGERVSGQNIPMWVYISLLGVLGMMACYLAWRDAQKQLAEKDTRKRDIIIQRLSAFISEYNQIDDGWLKISLENSGKLMQRDAYYKRVNAFLEQHWGSSAVEQFRERKVIYLEELIGKLMNEDQ